MIKIKSYNTDNIILTKVAVNSYISMFWNDIYSLLNVKNQHLMILVKVLYSEDNLGYRTLGHLVNVN